MHYIIIIVFIVAIIVLQVKVFSATKKKLSIFKGIFPKAAYEEWHLMKDGTNVVRIVGNDDLKNADATKQETISQLENEISRKKAAIVDLQNQQSDADDDQGDFFLDAQIRAAGADLQELMDRLYAIKNAPLDAPAYRSTNVIRNTIIESINNYLEHNYSSTSDFHLIKDIVDRNCDAADEEIQTQLPVPLYCGLMGTMLGIIVGILYLWLSGDLDALLGATTAVASSGGAEGIKALLGGVALAMISSIVGIALTTYGSWSAKQIKSEEESAKHNFLSWMQAELLPAMNTDATSAMRTMVENLSAFNDTFATNTKELNASLSHVTETTKGQAAILDAINNLKITRIATANIEVYDKLKNCTAEIGQLGEYLSHVREYLTHVQALNQKLDDADARSRMIEEMADYFKRERANIDKTSGIIIRSMGEADSTFQRLIENQKENITKQSDELVQHMVEQNQRLERVLDEQQSTLEKKSQELSRLVTEVTQMTDIKTTMQNVEKVMSEQNRKMDKLIQSIQELSQLKVTGSAPAQHTTSRSLPKWLVTTFVVVFIIFAVMFILGCIIMLVGVISSPTIE